MIIVFSVIILTKKNKFNFKNLLQILIFSFFIIFSRIVELLSDDYELINLDIYQLFMIRSLIPIIIFMGLEYQLSFEIRKDNKLGFRSITSGIQIALISFMWFREITLGAQDLFFRNLIANVVFLIIGVLMFLEISVSFLEKRTLIELSTQLFLTSIKLILILSGKELPLSLMIFNR